MAGAVRRAGPTQCCYHKLGALPPDCLCEIAVEAVMIMRHDTIERARHRWREILPRLGIGTRFLQNRHGPCPLCGGKDRFRFDDRDGSGSYYCNQCGPGPGLLLIRKLHAWDHATACAEVDKIIGNGSAAVSAPKSTKSPTTKAAAIERLLQGARH